MEIKLFGENCFSIKEGKVRVVIDPTESLTPELTEDDVIITTDNKVKVSKKGLKVFDWPGEYETKGVLVYAIATDFKDKEKRVLSFEIEGTRICNLATITEPLTDLQIGELGNVDILIVPMTLKVKDAVEMIEEIDPRLVIPSMLNSESSVSNVGEFLKEVGQAGLAPEEKLVIKQKSELDQENVRYVLLG